MAPMSPEYCPTRGGWRGCIYIYIYHNQGLLSQHCKRSQMLRRSLLHHGSLMGMLHSFQILHPYTDWCRPIGCLNFVSLVCSKRPVTNIGFSKNDLPCRGPLRAKWPFRGTGRDRGSYGSTSPFTSLLGMLHTFLILHLYMSLGHNSHGTQFVSGHRSVADAACSLQNALLPV